MNYNKHYVSGNFHIKGKAPHQFLRRSAGQVRRDVQATRALLIGTVGRPANGARWLCIQVEGHQGRVKEY